MDRRSIARIVSMLAALSLAGCASSLQTGHSTLRTPPESGGALSYRLIRHGGRLTITTLSSEGVPLQTQTFNGKSNCRYHGYAVGADHEGGLLVVRYEASRDRHLLSARRFDASGHETWAQVHEADFADRTPFVISPERLRTE